MTTAQVDQRVESETEFIWLKDSAQLDPELDAKYALLPNRSLLLHNITLKVGIRVMVHVDTNDPLLGRTTVTTPATW